MDCPSCDDVFESDRSMKIHHKLSHGESLAVESSSCENCGSEFDYYPSNKSGKYCSSCVSNGIGWTSFDATGEDHFNWRGDYGFNEGPENINWRGGVEADFGKKWPTIRRHALERDNHTCQHCDSGENLHVHHLTPRRRFDNMENANVLENLVTLCSSCHMSVEHGSLSV